MGNIPSTFSKWIHQGLCGLPLVDMAWLQLQSQFYLETKFLFHQNCLFHYKALRSMTRIPLVPVYPSFLFIFQEEKIIAEIKKWNSKYCILISDSCFQCLYADRKFWSRRYLFPHLCIRISDSTGYPDREFFFLIQEEREIHSKSWSQKRTSWTGCKEVLQRHFKKFLN